MGTTLDVPCEEQSREKVTAIKALVAWALVSLPGVGQRFGNNNFRTAVPGPPAPTPRGAPPKTQIQFARDDGTRPTPGVAASTIKIHPSALASVTLEQSARRMLIHHQFNRHWFEILTLRKLTNSRLERGSPFASCGPSRYPKFHQRRRELL